MSRTLFVGTQPPSVEFEKSGEVLVPGGALEHVIALMNIPAANFFQKFDYINISPQHEPDGLDPGTFVANMRNIRPLLSGRRIVLFGPNVALAFEIERHHYDWCQFIDHPKWTDFHGLFCVIPYPTQHNKMFQNPEFRGMVCRTLDMLLEFSHQEEIA